jgi:hypothetical protein
MPTFCTSCGSTLDPGALFCASCGTRTAGQPPAVVPSATPPPAAAVQPPAPQATVATTTTSGGVVVKILVALLCIGVLLVLLVIGGIAYGAYRVKKKAEQLKQEYGISAEAFSGAGRSPTRTGPPPPSDPCALITKEEMAEATGLPIQQAVAKEKECSYTTADESEVPTLQTMWGDGKITMLAVRATGKIAETGPGMEMQTVTGVGDEAYYQNNTLTVRKGVDAFSIQFPAVLLTKDIGPGFDMAKRMAEIRDKEVTVARKALGRM